MPRARGETRAPEIGGGGGVTKSFTVTFELRGGTGNDGTNPQTVPKGEIATKPDAPTLTDFAFGLWYQDKERKVPFFFDTPITQNLTLYAGWNTPDHFTVRFHPNGGSATNIIEDQIIASGANAKKPTPPLHLKTDLTFINWYKDSVPTTASTPFDFDTETITQNTIIYAGWGYTVTFALEGGTGNTSTNPQTILIGSLATKPATAPTKTDATFGLWYRDEARLTPFFFTTEKITNPTIIYAKWNKTNHFTVRFHPNGGSAIPEQTIALNAKVTKPENPTLTDRIFGEWYKDEKLLTPFKFDTETITLNTIIYAGWGSTWKAVAAGRYYTVGIQEDDTLWAWGNSWAGQLGLGDRKERHVPTQVGSDKDWSTVDVADLHTVAIKKDGTLWAWGYNGSGRLGLGDTKDRHVPTQVGTDKWKAVVAGGGSQSGHTVGIKEDDTLWAWGFNKWNGQLGLGDKEARHVPTRVGSDKDWSTVDAGDHHTVGIKKDGTLWAWGDNWKGQLGNGKSGKDADGESDEEETLPIQVGTAKNWRMVVAGENRYTVGIKTDGTLWTWGNNSKSQLGLGDTKNRNSPIQVDKATDWSMVFAGISNIFGIKEDNRLWVWGWNRFYQLGLGDDYGRNTPRRINLDTWKAVASGWYHTVGIQADGTLWAWGGKDEYGGGGNKYGQLGLGHTNHNIKRPTLVKEAPTP